jgi:hypothetical protein
MDHTTAVDWTKRIVKVEVTRSPSHNLDSSICEKLARTQEMSVLSLCLTRLWCQRLLSFRRGFYQYRSNDSDRTHYFIEFKHAASVDFVLQLNIPFVQFYSLAMNSELVDQFRSATRAPGGHNAEVDDGVSMPEALTSRQTFPAESMVPDNERPTAFPLRVHHASAALPFSLNTQIVMSLCGEIVTYDLKELEDDPRAIIHLLKVTQSERGNWITVGAQYRRNGNPSAARTVVTTMIEGKPHSLSSYCDCLNDD